MGFDAGLAVKTTAAAFEAMLALFLLPGAFSRKPGRDARDSALRLLVAAGLVKSALDFACGLAPDALPIEATALLSGALELAAATMWYLFIARYLWQGRGTPAKCLRPTLLWLGAWAALAMVWLASIAQAGPGADPIDGALYQALNWVVIAPYALSELLIACRRDRLQGRDAALMALFPLPAIAGIALSYIHPELIWRSPGLSLGLLAASLYLQTATSQRDPLTGAHTRSWFKAHLAERLKGAQAQPFMLMMIDLDNFKKINDTWGHLEGDRALVMAVELLRRSLRATDIIARFAGDEFLVLAGLSGPEDCGNIQRRIQKQLLEYNMNSGKPYALGWSTGMIYCDRPGNVEELLSAADEQMYRAKKEGRDKRAQAPARLYMGSSQHPKAM